MYDKVVAPHDESWEADPMGYFIVRVVTKRTSTTLEKWLRLEHYTPDNNPTTVVTGEFEDLRKYVLKAWPHITMIHYGYLCQEIGRAQVCMETGREFTQV